MWRRVVRREEKAPSTTLDLAAAMPGATATMLPPGLYLRRGAVSEFSSIFLLDEDGSGTVEWTEFVNAVNALETGSSYDKLVFCFRVYDRDNSKSIEREELLQMFSSMLLSAGGQKVAPPSTALKEVRVASRSLATLLVAPGRDSTDQLT